MVGTTPEGEACPFYFSWAHVKQGGATCMGKLCKLWNKEENECNINVIAKLLKK
jgi:hypothetical protein